jgi:hypothetical protein
VQIGVVRLLLGNVADTIGKRQRVDKVPEPEFARQVTFGIELPLTTELG